MMNIYNKEAKQSDSRQIRLFLAAEGALYLTFLIGYGIWFFYLPAQVCIALAGTIIDNNRRNYS